MQPSSRAYEAELPPMNHSSMFNIPESPRVSEEKYEMHPVHTKRPAVRSQVEADAKKVETLKREREKKMDEEALAESADLLDLRKRFGEMRGQKASLDERPSQLHH